MINCTDSDEYYGAPSCPDFPMDTAKIPCDRTRALVADDERGVMDLFIAGIRQVIPMVSVDAADNGQAALDAFCKAHHGVLVMDVKMPIMDGPRAFREIEAYCAKKNWEMPSVLFCTAYMPSGIVQRALANPAHGLLLKPITGKEVAEAVKSRLLRTARL